MCVCTGNVCRSPVAEAVFRAALPDVEVSSAGLYALIGRDIDADSATAARNQDVVLIPHSARQFDTQLGNRADLILVMDQAHRDEISRRWPQFSGKTMLLGHFEKGKAIPDPYLMGAAMHLRAVEMIRESVTHWVQQLATIRGSEDC